MDNQYILSLEELGFALAYCGYDDMAIGLLKEDLGDLSEEGWHLVFQTASRSLYTKGILLDLNEERINDSFVPGFKELLDAMATSERMIRGYNESEERPFILTIHKGNGKVVYHVVANDILHVLSIVNEEALIQEITDFYQPSFVSKENKMTSGISEELFNELMEYLQVGKDPLELINKPAKSDLNSLVIETFIQDYRSPNSRFVNLSVIETPKDEYPLFNNICFLLLSENQTWIVQNINPDKEQEASLIIEALTEEGWLSTINAYIASL
ncbi:hypothetical protein J2S09_001283 [Bacillus fengqiuensis]|nr:hypothetical protein [Bacillus fengqiuensis]